MPVQPTPEQQRAAKARKKYVELEPGRVVVNFYSDWGIRPTDLVSRNPDVLREFKDKDEAVAFEEDCYKKKERGDLDMKLLNRIVKSELTIQDHQKPPKPTSDEQHSETRNVVREGLDEAEELAAKRRRENLAESAETKAAAEKNGSKLNQVIGMLQSKTKGHAGPQWSAIIIGIRVRELGTFEWISEDLSRDLLGLELEKLAFSLIDRTS